MKYIIPTALSILLLAACGDTAENTSDTNKEVTEVAANKTSNTSETDASKNESKEPEIIEPTPEEKAAMLESLHLSGKGDTATNKVTLEDGFVIIHAKHSGSSNFILELLDTNGNTIQMPVNEVGAYEGQKIYNVEAGEYLFNVNADGEWDIQLSQYIPDTVFETSAGAIEGGGDGVIFVNMNSGARTFKMTHNGDSNFIINVSDAFNLVNEIGPYEGSQMQQVTDDGIYFFDITADGDWSITIE